MVPAVLLLLKTRTPFWIKCWILVLCFWGWRKGGLQASLAEVARHDIDRSPFQNFTHFPALELYQTFSLTSCHQNFCKRTRHPFFFATVNKTFERRCFTAGLFHNQVTQEVRHRWRVCYEFSEKCNSWRVKTYLFPDPFMKKSRNTFFSQRETLQFRRFQLDGPRSPGTELLRYETIKVRSHKKKRYYLENFPNMGGEGGSSQIPKLL